MQLATRGEEKPTGSRGSPQPAPERESGAHSCGAETAKRVRSTWTGAGRPASAMRTAGAVRHAQSPATRSLNAFVSPNSSRLFSGLRKGPRPASLDPRCPHTGTWVAGT